MPTISADSYEGKCHDPVLVSIVKKHHGWITKVCCLQTIFVCELYTTKCHMNLLCTMFSQKSSTLDYLL